MNETQKVDVLASLDREIERASGEAYPVGRKLIATRAVPLWEDLIEPAMLVALERAPKLKGATALLVDISGSMQEKLSAHSDLTRLDAAKALAIMIREVCSMVGIFVFDTSTQVLPPRRGFALGDAIGRPQGGTHIAQAVRTAQAQGRWDRIIVVTDEQSSTAPPAPGCKGYVMNVASAERGVGYGAWTHIHGFSERVVRYVIESEQA